MVATNAVAPSIGDASVRILPDITSFGPNLSKEMGQRAPLIAAAFGAALAAPLAASISAAVDFEAEFANVAKTVDATTEELASLETGIRNLATEIPATAGELAGIAAAAGQLGVEVTKIEEFTEVIAKLDVAAESIDAETAALQLAKFVNITGGSLDEVDNLGAALVDLGNKFPAMEGEILNFSQLIAGAGTTLGLTQAEILALATSLASAGIRAERGGSSISRLILEMQQAVATASPRLGTFAELVGLTQEKFQELVKTDPGEAIVQVIESFGALSEGAPAEAITVLDDLNLNTIRVRDTMLRLGIAADVVRDAVTQGNKAFKEGTALETEYAKFAETLSAQFQVFKNTINELFIEIGDAFLPILKAVLPIFEGFVNLVRKIPTPILAFVAAAASLAGTLTILGAGFLYSGQFLAKLIVAFGPLRRELGGLIPLFRKFAFDVLDPLNKSLARTSFSIDSVRKSASGGRSFWSSNLIGPLGIAALAVGALTTAFLIMKDHAEDVEKTTISVGDAVELLKKRLDPATESVENFVSAVNEAPDEKEVTITYREENAETIETLRSLSGEGRKAFGAQLIFELLLDGVPPEEAVELVKQLFRVAGVTLPVELEIENPEDIFAELTNAAKPTADRVASILNESFAGAAPIFPEFFDPTLTVVQDSVDSLAQTIIGLAEAGQIGLATKLWRDYEETIGETVEGTGDAALANRLLAEAILEGSGTIGVLKGDIKDLDSAMKGFSVDPTNIFGFRNFADSSDFALFNNLIRDELIQTKDTFESAAPTIGERLIALNETHQQVFPEMAAAQTRYREQTESDIPLISEAFLGGIPILEEYAGAVELNLEEASESLLNYVNDEAAWNQLTNMLTGRISGSTQAALDNIPLPERAALADAIFGDDEQARADALGYISLLEAVYTDPENYADIDLDEFVLGDPTFVPQIEFESDTIRMPPHVREEVGEQAAEVLEAAFEAKNMTGAFSNSEQVYETLAQIGIEAYKGEHPEEAVLAVFEGITIPAELRDEFEALGFELMGGVVIGINKGSPSVSGATESVIGKAVEVAKKVAGVQSPSKLFRDEVGLQIGLGLAEGIGMATPDVESAMTGLIDTAAGVPVKSPKIDPAFSGGLPSSSGPMTVIFNNPKSHSATEDARRTIGVLRTAQFNVPNGRIV